MDFSIADFTKLRYRVDLITEYSGKPLEIFPDLNKYAEFTFEPTIVNPLKIFKYVTLICDKESPLLAIDSISKMETQAAILSNFDKDKNGEIQKEYIDVMNWQNAIINRWVLRYYTFNNDEAFANMRIYKKKLHQQREILLITTDAEELVDINKNIQTFSKFYEDCRKQFLQGNINSAGLNEELFKFIEEEEIPSPESVAYSLREGIDPTLEWSPYGKNYKPILTMGNARHIYKPGEEIPPLKQKEK